MQVSDIDWQTSDNIFIDYGRPVFSKMLPIEENFPIHTFS